MSIRVTERLTCRGDGQTIGSPSWRAASAQEGRSFMSRAVDELRQIPFDHLIGAPMKAAIEAQGLAAKTTIDFIEKVGFLPEDPDQDPFFEDEEDDVEGGRVRNVTFQYSKTDANGQP